MFIIKLMRWLKGYVSFTAAGVFAERFLNLVSHTGLSIWNVKKSEQQLTANTLVRDYKKLRPCAKRSGVRLRVQKRFGFPFYVSRYDKRAGIVLGVCLMCAFLFAAAQFIWTVDVSGNQLVSSFDIVKALENQGIYPGALKKDISVPLAKQRILLALKDLSWIAINISGATAKVEVREKIPQPDMVPLEVPSNIIAARSGQILRLEVYDGDTLVEKGDSVKEGALLVSGIIEGKFGKNILVHSSAKIIAQVQDEKVYDIPLNAVTTRFTGRERTRRILKVVNADIPIWFCSAITFDYQLETTEKPLTLFGAKLPLVYREERCREIIKEQVPVSENDAKKAAVRLIADYELNDLQPEEVLSRAVSVERGQDFYRVTVNLVANVDIAKQQEIFTEKS